MARSSSTTSSANSFGFHHEEIQKLKDDWDTFNDGPRCQLGSTVLKCLLERKEGFYFSNSFFDIPDHPVKILPYPKSQPIPTLADAIQDMLAIHAHDFVDRVSLNNGNFCHDHVSGPEMVNRMFMYLENRSQEHYNSVVYPLSMDIPTHGPHESRSGIGKVDVNALVPAIFRERDRIYLPDSEGWKTALVPPPALATTHYDHPFCGQVMAHFFGRKIWLFCPPDSENMKIWYNIENVLNEPQRMKAMVSSATNLFVWVSEQPCVMVLPPHCFHTVFTLSTACHSGVRAGSDLWKEKMSQAVARMCDHEEKKFIRKNPILLERIMNQMMPDIQLWIRWCESIQREPTPRELEVMTIFVPLINVLKFNLRGYKKI